MKIAITVKGAGLGAWLDPNFGECMQLMLIDDKNHFEAWENPHRASSDTAEALVAQQVIAYGPDVLITGKLPEDLLNKFQQANISVMEVESGMVLDLVETARASYPT